MRRTLTALWISALLVGGLAAARAASAVDKSDSEIEESIREVLIQRHPTDAKEFWRGLGPKAPRVIMGMIPRTEGIYHRIRLVEALGWFDDPAVAEFLKGQARKTDDGVVRNAAVRAVGRSQGAAGVGFVAEFLAHQDAQTRLAAAETLAQVSQAGDPVARRLLDAYLLEEKTPWIVARVKDASLPSVPPLKPVASSEDRLASALAGRWRGFWLQPGPSGGALDSETASLKLMIEGESALQGELQLRTRKSARTIALKKAKGKGGRFSGVFAVGKVELPFEAELTQEAGASLVEFRISKAGARLFVRKETSDSGN